MVLEAILGKKMRSKIALKTMFFEIFSNFHNENHIPPLGKNVLEVVLDGYVQAESPYIIPRGPLIFYPLVFRFSALPRCILKRGYDCRCLQKPQFLTMLGKIQVLVLV